ncbi:hypothetical protein NFI96_026219 [Prochilodus magdalenae]|nr:hypothetical protein NFI96_026219 [Prochilodus magdalenae]
MMGNVNSLANKTDELAALVRNQRLYRECSLLCLTETWLTGNIPDTNVDIPGFATVRADRDAKLSGKSKGGGLVLFVNIRWCNPGHVTVKERICCRDYELLAVSLRPYYMPRELSHAIAVCVYVPQRADPDIACDVIHATPARLQTQHPDAFITLDSVLTAFHQCVDCPTSRNRTIDLLYANVKDAYTSTSLPPLGKSDHSCGMKTITGYMQRTDGATDGDVERANEFNTFYNRFDCPVQVSAASADTSSTLPLTSAPDTSVSDSLDINTPPSPFVIHAPLPQADSSANTAPVPPFSHLVSSDLTCSTTKAHTSPLLHTFTADQVRVPKKGRPSELNDFRPVALTSHVMKTLERLLLHLLRPQVQHTVDPLQFAYREKVGVEDAMLYLLHRAHSHLDKGGSTVRVMFFDFSSAFNTIQPFQLREKLARMQVDPHLVSWITDYLTGRPQYVRLKDCTSETVVSSTGAPQGTVLSPFLFTLYTSDFKYNSETCHMQNFSDDTAIVACVRGGQEAEYRNLVEDFVAWCHKNNLLLNTSKTKEMVVDFRRARPLTQPVFIEGVKVEMVRTYRYLGLHLDERLDWSANTDILYRKGQS